MNETGKIGEEIAAKYFAGLSYKILFKNHKEKMDEIDLIVRSPRGILVFAEVKTISINTTFQNGFLPEDHLDGRKMKRLIRGARMFLARHPGALMEVGWQIDLVAVSVKNGKLSNLRHYENI